MTVLINERRPLDMQHKKQFRGHVPIVFSFRAFSVNKTANNKIEAKTIHLYPFVCSSQGAAEILGAMIKKIITNNSVVIHLVNSTLQLFSILRRLGKGSNTIGLQKPCLAKAQGIFHLHFTWAS